MNNDLRIQRSTCIWGLSNAGSGARVGECLASFWRRSLATFVTHPTDTLIVRYQAGAGVASAVPESLIKGPTEAVKVLKQASAWPPPAALGSMASLAAKGVVGMLMREVPGNVGYFHAMEAVRSAGFSPLAAGVAAAAGFTAAAYPLDVCRVQLVLRQPLRPSMRGVTPFLIRGSAITACLLAFYEVAADALKVQRTIGCVATVEK